jgi:hypothetical protein
MKYLHLTDDESESEVVSYLVIYEINDDKNCYMIDDLEDAKKWKEEKETSGEYKYVSQVYMLNLSSHHHLMGKIISEMKKNA